MSSDDSKDTKDCDVDICNPCGLCPKKRDCRYKSPCDPCNECCPPDPEYACAVYVAELGTSPVAFSAIRIVDSEGEVDPKAYDGKTLLNLSNYPDAQGLVFDRQCNLYVANGNAGTTGDISAHVYVIPKHEDCKPTTIPIGQNPDTPNLRQLAVDDCGNLYIADNANGLVYQVGCEGQHVFASLTGAWGVAYDNKHKLLYVTSSNAEASVIESFNGCTSNPLTTKGEEVNSSTPGYPLNAVFTALSINSKNELFVADTTSNSVYKVVRNRDPFCTEVTHLVPYTQVDTGYPILYMDFDIFDNLYITTSSTTIKKLLKKNRKTLETDLTDGLQPLRGVATKKGPLPKKCRKEKKEDCSCDDGSKSDESSD